jgi:hypothetical protein
MGGLKALLSILAITIILVILARHLSVKRYGKIKF